MRLYSDYTPIDEHYSNEDCIFCCVCGKELHYTERSYSADNESVCSDNSCMEAFYENNADHMLVEFADEIGMREEAKEWFFENL